jgi:hypothetical protein
MTACHAVVRGSIPLETAIFATFVYRFRTLAFHAGETGSIPVGRTNKNNIYSIGRVGEWFNPSVLKTEEPQGSVSSNLTPSAKF